MPSYRGKGIWGHGGHPELGGDDQLRSGGTVAGGGDGEDGYRRVLAAQEAEWGKAGDRGDGGPKRPSLRRDAEGVAGACHFDAGAHEDCRRVRESVPEPTLLSTTTTGNELPSWSGSVFAVTAVWRLALACMGGANGSSVVANTNPYPALLLEDVDDGDGG